MEWTLGPDQAAALSLLLKAQSKATVMSVCKESFLHRNGKVPEMVVATLAKALDVQPLEANKLILAMCQLIKNVLFEGLSDARSIAALFPENFHENLKALLAEAIARNLPEWKLLVNKDQVSLPHLVDFDWRVDVKTASDSVSRMSQPTCLVQMKIQDSPKQVGEVPAVKSVNVEFSKEALDTMLDGLGKIRDQLSSVAKST